MNETIEFNYPYTPQGDLNIYSLDVFGLSEIPKDLVEKSPETDGKHVLAHSETGHHHVIDGNAARVFEENEFSAFIDVKEKTNVIHLRSFDTHKTISLPPGQYRITRQREHTPEGYRRAQD